MRGRETSGFWLEASSALITLMIQWHAIVDDPRCRIRRDASGSPCCEATDTFSKLVSRRQTRAVNSVLDYRLRQSLSVSEERHGQITRGE